MAEYRGTALPSPYVTGTRAYLASGYHRESEESSAAYLRKRDYTSYSAPRSKLAAATPSVNIVSRASLF